MKNKKALILLVCLAVLLAGCGLNLGKNKAEKAVKPEIKEEAVANNIATSSERIATATKIEIASSTEKESDDSVKIAKKTETDFLIPEVGARIIIPGEHTVTKSEEKNRRGSFVSYDFSYSDPSGYSNPPSFQEIQFFSEKSIEQFVKNCVDQPCFFGDYPDFTRYNGQKNAFYKNKDYGKYVLKNFGGRNYFVSNIDGSGGGGMTREYTTFIDETKIDIWVGMLDSSQDDAADALFDKFKIMK